jgi:tetratricopeptide (TPR) repeat protein
MADRVARRVRIAALACLTAAVAATGGPALAAAPDTLAPEREARERFQKAEMSFNLGRFDDALADYQAAYQAKPLPAFLFNIAQCYRNLGNYERAQFFYRRYLALDPHTSNRRLVEDLIAEMSRKGEKEDEAGKATAMATADPAYLAVGDLAPAPVTMPPAPVPPPAAPVLLAREAEPPSRPVYRRWWFWAGVGAAAAAIGVLAWVATRPGSPHGSLGTIDGR